MSSSNNGKRQPGTFRRFYSICFHFGTCEIKMKQRECTMFSCMHFNQQIAFESLPIRIFTIFFPSSLRWFCSCSVFDIFSMAVDLYSNRKLLHLVRECSRMYRFCAIEYALLQESQSVFRFSSMPMTLQMKSMHKYFCFWLFWLMVNGVSSSTDYYPLTANAECCRRKIGVLILRT